MAKIPTPALATLVNDLPTLDGTETGKNIIVTTNQGLRKVDWDYFQAANNYLIGMILAVPYGTFIEKGVVPLFGGVLKPEWFRDSLAVLKRRCPLWVDAATGNVQLPDMQNIVLQMDYRLWAFERENDALQNIKGKFGGGWGPSPSGPFKDLGVAGYQLKRDGGGGDGWIAINYEMDTQRDSSLRTAEETRENTRNITWCVYAGELVDPNPEHIFYGVKYSENIGNPPVGDTAVTWPFLRLYRPSTEAEGIGYNPSIMERSQVDVDDPWNPTKVKAGKKK